MIKKIALLVLMLTSFLTYGQKPVKPNLNKALKSLQDGNLAEAKEIIDAATTYEKTMNDGKTWYYRGLIYAALDTTSKAEFKSLAKDPLTTAVESFIKADQLGKSGSEYFTNAPNSVVPVLKSQQLEMLSNYYLDKSIKAFQEKDDIENCIAEGYKCIFVFEKAMSKYANDTLAYYVIGAAEQNVERYDSAIATLNKYLKRGGKSKDAYLMLYQIYSGPKDDKATALKIIQEGKAKLPSNPDFPKVEIGLLIDLDRVDEAKNGLEAAIKKEPNNKIFHFYLGYINSKLEKWEESKKNFEDAIKLDPAYFEAQYYLAQIYYIDAFNAKKEMNNLGISAADKKRKIELDKIIVEKFKTALPYMEKADKLKPNDVDVLEKLSAIYYYLGEDAKAAVVNKKLKMLGVEN